MRIFKPSIDNRAPNVFPNTITLYFHDVSTQAVSCCRFVWRRFIIFFVCRPQNNFPVEFLLKKNIFPLISSEKQSLLFSGKIPAKAGSDVIAVNLEHNLSIKYGLSFLSCSYRSMINHCCLRRRLFYLYCLYLICHVQLVDVKCIFIIMIS